MVLFAFSVCPLMEETKRLFFFFGRFQHPPVDSCSTVSCDFNALTVVFQRFRLTIAQLKFGLKIILSQF